MLPSRSNTPADRSPASRTLVENAVRTSVCACSSTTAISRDHMICIWICDSAALGRVDMVHLSNLRQKEEQSLSRELPISVDVSKMFDLLAVLSSNNCQLSEGISTRHRTSHELLHRAVNLDPCKRLR